MARTQTLVQLTDELLAEVDALAARQGRNRSELIRDALSRYLSDDPDAEIDRRIVAAYTRQPQTPDELALAELGARAMIGAEPWEPARGADEQ